ncbi:hypothetical protein Patl1_11012 [Pistacia atlantica]|uniref:Uncharacterized protein n=1 Tax=Pistacia atlantica TaxID=434234 RepID=A0ACC1A1L2_9ROSI|nr:hypothetical protein Patl1_11012 [Pistacia atlantica]
MKPFMIFGFLFLLSFLLRFSSAADPTYVYHFCSNTTTFSINSTYQSNLNLLLSSLPSNANSSNGFFNGFYNTTLGQGPNKVYILFLCRGDVTTSVCQDLPNETLTAAPAPTPVILSPPPPGSATGPQGKIRISSSIIIAIVVPTAVAVVALFISGYCVLSRKAKKKYNVIPEDNGKTSKAISLIIKFQTNLLFPSASY